MADWEHFGFQIRDAPYGRAGVCRVKGTPQILSSDGSSTSDQPFAERLRGTDGHVWDPHGD